MFRSMSRITVAVALVFAFALSTVPAQAQPRDLGPSIELEASWFEVAMAWLQGLLGGDPELLQSEATKDEPPVVPVGTGPCIDPYGRGCLDNW